LTVASANITLYALWKSVPTVSRSSFSCTQKVYASDNTLQYRTDFTWDGTSTYKGKTYDASGALMSSYMQTVNSAYQMVSMTQYQADGTVTSVTKCTYDSSNRCVRNELYSGSTLYYYTTVTYDSTGKSTETQYNADGTATGQVTVCTYDSKGNKISAVTTSGATTSNTTYVYVYNSTFPSLIDKTTATTTGSSTSTQVTTSTFDSQGRVTREDISTTTSAGTSKSYMTFTYSAYS
jgi:hypothetical protein